MTSFDRYHLSISIEAVIITQIIQNVIFFVNFSSKVESGIYTISPDGQQEFDVYCDPRTQGGRWTVFQKRFDGTVDFSKTGRTTRIDLVAWKMNSGLDLTKFIA